MRSLFLIAIVSLTCWLPGTLRAQDLGKRPNYDVEILADGKPIDLSKGIPATTKVVNVLAKLTAKSSLDHPQLKTEVLINKATISLVRDTRRVNFINWTGSEPIAIGLSPEARSGDRYVIQFEDVSVQTKTGVIHKLAQNDYLLQVTIQ